jgi:outer membrane protein assembly factor BamD (BamD/ComL family)
MQIGAGQFEAATNTCEELVAAAEKTGRSDFRAESFALQGEVLERLSRRDDAIAAFKHNLGSDTPAERQRQALLKVSELLLAQNRLAEAGDTLERFLAQFTNSPATDMALLTLGELHLKQHVAATTNGVNGVTNHLALAEAQLDRLIGTFTNSALLGKAELDRGWCYWVSHRVPESAVAFARAAGRLSDSEDLAIARFKLGDALFEQNDFAGAAKKYRGALDLFAHWPQLGESLRPQALYQLLRASCAATNLADADDAMKQILQLPAGGAVAERSVLLAGQAHTEAGDPIKAREVFAQFTALFPESPLRPEVELAIARTHEQQDDWTGAVNNYTSWLERYETNALRPQAEFQLALANFRAGNETNALNLFTNFVAQYPTNKALAPRAQWWVADYYYGLGGANYGESEKNYKKIFQDWPDSELAFEARMMAGRAAVGRSVYADAIGHFTNLTGNLKCPPGLWTQAMFAYGDVLMSWATTDTNKLANYEEALKVFGKIQQRFPGSEAAVLAWGEMAKCYRQKGEATNATFAFSQVMTSAVASVSARGEAQVGLALLQEEQAQKLEGEEQRSLLTQALNNYLEVFYEVIPSREGETRNLRWVKEAGLKAVRVTETLGQWDQMERLCRRLATLVPQLQESLDKKIAKAREQLAAKKSE